MSAPTEIELLHADRMLLEALCAVVTRSAKPSDVDFFRVHVAAYLSAQIHIGDDARAYTARRSQTLALARVAAFLVSPDPPPTATDDTP
jgi:hypothetical protein